MKRIYLLGLLLLTSLNVFGQIETEEQAIMVGTNTVKIDDPQLTARLWKGKNPLRVVLDRALKLSKDLHIYDENAPTLVFTEKSPQLPQHRQIVFNEELLEQILAELFEQNIQSVIVEGGKRLLETFLAKDLWDEARIFTGNVYFRDGIQAPKLLSVPTSSTNLGDNLLTLHRNTT